MSASADLGLSRSCLELTYCDIIFIDDGVPVLWSWIMAILSGLGKSYFCHKATLLLLVSANQTCPSPTCKTMCTGHRCKWQTMGWRGGSIGRALDLKTPGSNPIGSTRQICESFIEPKMLCWLVSVSNSRCVYTRIRMIGYARLRSCSPCRGSVDYGNMKRPSMHLEDWVALLLRLL